MKFRPMLMLAAAALTGSAFAGVPVMQISVVASGGGSGTASPAGGAGSGANQYNYNATIAGTGFVSTFNLTAVDTSASNREVLGGSISVVNGSASTQTFTIDFNASTLAQGTSSLTGGSISGVLTGNADGGLFTSFGSTPIWSAYIKTSSNNTIASLLAAPYSVTSQPNMVASIPGEAFGTPIPSLPSMAMGDAAGIRLVFQLGAGDQVDLTTAFVIQSVVPAPGATAALAMACMGARRRRRA